MLPKELAVAEAWLLAMLFVERARAFMIFPTFVLITSRSALKSAFQVVAANPNPHPHAAGRSPPDAGGKLQRAFHTKSLPARVRNGRVGSAPGPAMAASEQELRLLQGGHQLQSDGERRDDPPRPW